MHGDLVESAKITVGAGFYPARAVQYRGCGRTNANTFPVCRGRCRALPARSTSVLTIRCGKFAIAPRADRVVRPYKTLCDFADGVCNAAIAHRRVDVGIDPYGDFARSPFVVQFRWCTVRGRGRTPPLRKTITSSLFTIPSYLPCSSPTLRQNAMQHKKLPPASC